MRGGGICPKFIHSGFTVALGEKNWHCSVLGRTLLSSQPWALSADICSLPKDSGYCLAYFPHWFYNKENSTCQLFIYGGCQGNNNNFQSQSLCQKVCQKKSESWRGYLRAPLGPFGRCGLACPKAARSFSDLAELDLIRSWGRVDLIRNWGRVDLIRSWGRVDLIRTWGRVDLIRSWGGTVLWPSGNWRWEGMGELANKKGFRGWKGT